MQSQDATKKVSKLQEARQTKFTKSYEIDYTIKRLVDKLNDSEKNVLINLDNCNNRLFNTLMYSKSGIYILNNTNITCKIRDSLIKNDCPNNNNIEFNKKILFINKYIKSVCYSSNYLSKMTTIGTFLIIIATLNIILAIKIIYNKINPRIYPSNNLYEINLNEINLNEINL
jgi:hypothetical protein